MSCAVADCEIPGPFKRGWCARHYMRWRRNGDPLVIRKPWERRDRQPQQCWCGKLSTYRGLCGPHYRARLDESAPPCSEEGCSAPSRAKGLCNKHHIAARRRDRGVPSREQLEEERPDCRECGTPGARRGSALCVRCYNRLYKRDHKKSKPRRRLTAVVERGPMRGEWIDTPDGYTIVHWPPREGWTCPICSADSAQAA